MTLMEWFEPISLYPVEGLWTLDVFLDAEYGETIDAFSYVAEWVTDGADVLKIECGRNDVDWIGSYSVNNSSDLMEMIRQDLLGLEINTCWIVGVNRIVVLLNKENMEGEDDYDTDS